MNFLFLEVINFFIAFNLNNYILTMDMNFKLMLTFT